VVSRPSPLPLIPGLGQPESCADMPDPRSSHPPHPTSGLPATVTDAVVHVAADSDLSLAVHFEVCKVISNVTGVFAACTSFPAGAFILSYVDSPILYPLLQYTAPTKLFLLMTSLEEGHAQTMRMILLGR